MFNSFSFVQQALGAEHERQLTTVDHSVMRKEDKIKIAELLNTDEIRSKIIADTSYFDTYLGVCLSMYFSPAPRNRFLHETVIDGLSFGRKLQILSSIQFRRKHKSLECIPTLKRLQKLRNHVAHSYFTIHFDKIFKDTESLRLLQDYPIQYNSTIKTVKNQLSRLTRVKEFMEIYENA